MSGHGKLKAKTSGDGDFVIVETVDYGPGIPREAKSRIVAGHGGEIRVDSKPGETSFKVRLPIDGPRRDQNEDGDVPNGG